MKTHRLFIGTFIDQHIFKDIYDDIYEDFGAEGGRWVEAQNLHFSYKFIGDVAASELPILKNIIRGTLKKYDNTLTITGLDAFPNIRRPRVLYANIESQGNLLTKIFFQIENKLSQMGFEKDNKRYSPSITLKRVKETPPSNFIPMINKYRSHHFGIMNHFKVDLIESVVSPTGLEYCNIEMD